MATRAEILELGNPPAVAADEQEESSYLSEQLITYLGSLKRALLPLIHGALQHIQGRLGVRKLRMLDAFAGSGIVSRYSKKYAAHLISNDLEQYACVIGTCYLSNGADLDLGELRQAHEYLLAHVNEQRKDGGIIRRHYSPREDARIRPGERVFYTARNAMLLDSWRQMIGQLPVWQQPYFLAPLLAEASVHANTSGVFKGFYKDRTTGVGQFGGHGRDALARILGEITLPFPVFSRFSTECRVTRQDANELVATLKDLDVAYFDPPYNQHPYGSNYFMLNLLVDYQEPRSMSDVSGIPGDWNRSRYNKRGQVLAAMQELFARTEAKFILLSYNDEGFVGRGEIEALMAQHGKVTTLEKRYNTFRGCRNLRNRSLSVTEHLFVVERS